MLRRQCANVLPGGEFLIGDDDRLFGHIGGMQFDISGPQFASWRHTQLIIDVVPGRGGMFSVEGPGGVPWMTRSRLFSGAQCSRLQPAPANGATRATG